MTRDKYIELSKELDKHICSLVEISKQDKDEVGVRVAKIMRTAVALILDIGLDIKRIADAQEEANKE